MKYPAEAYAAAFFEAVKENKKDEGKIIPKFLQTVRKNGDWGSVNKIFKMIAKKMAGAVGGRSVSVECARKPGKDTVEKLMKSFSEKDYVEFHIVPELVAGTRILINGERELDTTLLNKMNKLFS